MSAGNRQWWRVLDSECDRYVPETVLRNMAQKLIDIYEHDRPAGGTAPTDPPANRNEMENPAMTTTANQDTAPPPDTTPEGLLYTAWTIIANAGHNRGGWEAQDPEWVTAAERWRDQWHATL